MLIPPVLSTSFEDLPADPKERHEMLVDVFGEYLMWARKVALDIMRRRVEAEEERQGMGRLFRACYDEAAKLSPEDRERAFQLTEATLANFARVLLTMLSGGNKLGPDHAFRYKLVMEICSAASEDILSEEVINRNGRKFFPEYWGRWLNQCLAKSKSEPPHAS